MSEVCFICDLPVASKYDKLCSKHDEMVSELIEQEVLCDHCPCTEFGDAYVNSGPWNMCEGSCCHEALDYYLDSEYIEPTLLKKPEKVIIDNDPNWNWGTFRYMKITNRLGGRIHKFELIKGRLYIDGYSDYKKKDRKSKRLKKRRRRESNKDKLRN